MLKNIKFIIAAFIPVVFSLSTVATPITDTFNSGIPADWVCAGNCGASAADGVVTAPPTGSANYGWVSTDGGIANTGLSGLIGNEGTILQSNLFAADAGDDLEFFFNYITSDGSGFADYAWARLLDNSFTQVAMLFTARTKSSGNIVPGDGMPLPEATLTPGTVEIIGGAPSWSPLGSDSGSCYNAGCGYTGWVQSNFTIIDAGNYYLEFGVTNWSDSSYDSGLAFDGITIAGTAIDDPTSVPEPTSIALLSLAFLGLFASKRKNS